MSLFFAKARPAEVRQPAMPVVGPWTQDDGSFTHVDLSRAESGYQKVAVWASVNYIIQKAVSLPTDVYTGKGDQKREMPKPSWLDDPAGDGYGWGDWFSQVLASAMLRGNVFGLPADRDPRTGIPRALPIVHPDRVWGQRDPQTGLPVWRVGGTVVPREEFWHQRRYIQPGCLLGLSPIGEHALTIGLGIQVTRFGSQYFADGAMPTGILTNEEQQIGQKAAKVAKNRFLAALRGTREPLVLGKGWKYQAISISPEESQFLETQGYTGAECCRIYGPHLAQILGYPTGDSLTYANRVDIQTSLETDTIDPWLTWAEGFISRTLLPKTWYLKFNRNALVRADIEKRFGAYAAAITGGWMTADEVRRLEDMPDLTDDQKAEIAAGKKPAAVPGAPEAPPAPEQKSAPIRVPAQVGPAIPGGQR